MEFRWLASLKHQAGHFALARGPQIFCLPLAANPSLAERKQWREITVDPNSLRRRAVARADSVRRPLEVTARAWGPDRALSLPPDLTVVLADFPVPDGQETYVKISQPERAGRDELYDAPDGRIPTTPPDIAVTPDPY